MVMKRMIISLVIEAENELDLNDIKSGIVREACDSLVSCTTSPIVEPVGMIKTDMIFNRRMKDFYGAEGVQ